MKKFFESAREQDMLKELEELWVDDTHEWKYKVIMLTDTAEDLKFHDTEKGNIWLAKIWLKNFLQDVEMFTNVNDDKAFAKNDVMMAVQIDGDDVFYYSLYDICYEVDEYGITEYERKSIVKSIFEEHYGIKLKQPRTARFASDALQLFL
jgi:hypothetical protein